MFKVDVSKCSGCGTCVQKCPFNFVTMVEEKAEINTAECLGCGACRVFCPNQAIDWA